MPLLRVERIVERIVNAMNMELKINAASKKDAKTIEIELIQVGKNLTSVNFLSPLNDTNTKLFDMLKLKFQFCRKN